MNTGHKNELGRTIWKGPRGGEYVMSGARKVYTFKKTKTPTVVVKTGQPENIYGRVIHKGVRGGFYVLSGGSKVYKFIPKGSMNSVRAFYNSHPVKTPVVPVPVSPPRPRGRLESLKRIRREALPKRRENINARLKNVLARVRARLVPVVRNLAEKKRIQINICHAKASVPRTKCRNRKIDIDVYTDPRVRSGIILGDNEDSLPTKEWFEEQNKYISNLNDYDYWTVQAHTNRSHTWIGPYLYRNIHPLPASYPSDGKHMVPLWPQIRKMILNGVYRADVRWIQEFKALASEKSRYELYRRNINTMPRSIQIQAMNMYRDDLKRIISHAPKPKQKFILYRGTWDDLFRGTQGHWHTLTSFCSTAFYLKHALLYASRRIQRITILPGTPVLLVAGTNQWGFAGEYEVMVNVDTKYLIRQRNVKKWTLGGTVPKQLLVSEMTIAK